MRLGLPTAPDKTVGPSTTITFLGIELDSVAQELRLPSIKLQRLRSSLTEWESKRNTSKHELQVLIGHLSHAASVVRPGRVFIRHLIDTSKIPRRQTHRVRLNAKCCSDIAWWLAFAQEWNGVSLFPSLPPGPTLFSDASGLWGCGAYCQPSLEWFQLQWPEPWLQVNIAVKEMLPIVMSTALWGRAWRGSLISIFSDNDAVVTCLNSKSAREPRLAHLLRCFFFLQAHLHFEYRAQHVAGRRNTAADALSRNRSQEFFSIFPQAPLQSSQPPESLMDLLSDSSLVWTSTRWRALFTSSLPEASPSQQPQPTPLRNVAT